MNCQDMSLYSTTSNMVVTKSFWVFFYSDMPHKKKEKKKKEACLKSGGFTKSDIFMDLQWLGLIISHK